MNLKYKLGATALAVIALTSCETNDPFSDIVEPGQPVPTVTWSVGSTVANAGDSIEITGKYYTDKDHTPDHSEVWETVVLNESAAATVGLTSSLKYTQTTTVSDTVRTSMSASFPHSQAVWNGHEWQLDAKIPTSQTLKSVKWATPEEWDQKKFDSYYPSDFKQTFVDKVIDYLTKDNTYYADLRRVYVNYAFTEEQIKSVIANYPSLDQTVLGTLVLTETADKSDVWFVDATTVAGKYYTEIVDGKTVYHEVPTSEATDASKNYYDVYNSSPWVFCRYDDNTGGVVTEVRDAYMPVFKELISLIPFTEWIYNSSDKNYNVDFTRSYRLNLVYKVYDTKGNVGYTTGESGIKQIELN